MTQTQQQILNNYQVRKTKEQKANFRVWLNDHLKQLNYTVTEEAYSKKGTNIIVGDLEKAQVVLSAHYDTPPNFFFPVIMAFSNWISFLLSQFFILIPIACFCVLYTAFFIMVVEVEVSGFFFFSLFFLVYAYLLQIMIGFPNKQNANDNTSGVATLLSVLENLPLEERDKVCVVFFDQEELGLVGAGQFYKKHKEQLQNKPLINFDCVGNGETLTFVYKKKFYESTFFTPLEIAANQIIAPTTKKVRFGRASSNIYMSDQLYFPLGVGVVAAKKAPLIGYYVSDIHSSFDKKLDTENLDLLTKTILQFTKTI